jgi:hypothetical protein
MGTGLALRAWEGKPQLPQPESSGQGPSMADIGPTAAASYARTATQPGADQSKSRKSGQAKLVTESYGFKLGPLGIEYSRKEVEFSPVSGSGAASAGAAAPAPGFEAARAMRDLGVDQDVGRETEDCQGPEVSIRPRGLAAYAQSALGAKETGRRGSVKTVI